MNEFINEESEREGKGKGKGKGKVACCLLDLIDCHGGDGGDRWWIAR